MQSSSLPDVPERFQRAASLQRAGDYPGAIAAYQELLTQYPDHLASRYNLACLLAKGQHWQSAIIQFDCILLSEPNCVPACYNLAICYQGLQEEDTAIVYLERTLKLEPTHPLATQTLGSLLLKKQRYTEAITYLLTAQEECPTDTDVLFNLGLTLLHTGDDLNALRCFSQIRLLKPELIDAIYNCGVIYHTKGNYPAALRAFADVLQHDPQHYASLYNSGLIYQATQQYDLAMNFYQRAIKIAPTNSCLQFLLTALQQESTLAMPAEHVQNLFDNYAGHYETHMQENLHYTVPQQLHDLFCRTIANATRATQNLCLVDLGCGTGLVGQLFKDQCHTLVGVDLSPKMLAIAASKYCYTTVTQQDNIEYLHKIKRDIDMIVAADVLGYYGELDTLFTACQQALCITGLLLFSIETHDRPDSYWLAPHARFTHQPSYIQLLAQKHGFTIIAHKTTILRYQQQDPVKGALYLLQLC